MTQSTENTLYEPRTYWNDRLGSKFDLGGVGMLSLGTCYNNWLYRIRRSVISRSLKKNCLRAKEADTLDIGSGTGFWIDYWKSQNAKSITGLDITDVAVDQLQQKYPEESFQRVDISDEGVQLNQQFDFISAFDILFHITDDQRWKNSIKNISDHLRPEGYFLVTDLFLHNKELRGFHQVSRSLQEYETEFKKNGLSIIDRTPVFVFGHPAIDSEGWEKRVLDFQWKIQQKILGRGRKLKIDKFVSTCVGMMVYSADQLATRIFSEGPTTELIICKKEIN